MRKSIYKRRLWTEDEKKILAELFPDNYTEVVAKKLKRTYRSVCSQSFLMGLKKSDHFMKKELFRQSERLKTAGKNYRFSKGDVPVNKGKPMSKDRYKKCEATMFKKGSIPPNANYDGHERISKDGYYEIRIAPGKYVLKHRLIWEKSNGTIPEGSIVIFKDKNQKNVCIENLELITRKEGMSRNTIHRFPVELKSTIRLVNKLKRTINEKQD